MVLTIKDEDQRVIAYAEIQQVGKSGFPQWGGEYVWVHDTWVHPNYESRNMIIRLLDLGLNAIPGTKYMYFSREKYGGRISRLYTREKLTRRVRNGRTSTFTATPTACTA